MIEKPKHTPLEDETLPSSDPAEQIGILNSSLTQLSSDIIGDFQHSAPVKIPNREDLTVRLVNISMLARLDELRGDATLMQNFFWTVMGTLLGLITSLFSSDTAIDQIDKHSWILVVLIVIVAGVFGFLMVRSSRRADKLRSKLFQDSNHDS